MAGVRFKQTDIVRAIKAAESVGKDVRRMRIGPDGAIELDFEGEPQSEPPGAPDQWLINDEAWGAGHN